MKEKHRTMFIYSGKSIKNKHSFGMLINKSSFSKKEMNVKQTAIK